MYLVQFCVPDLLSFRIKMNISMDGEDLDIFCYLWPLPWHPSDLFNSVHLTCKEVEKLQCCLVFIKKPGENEDSPFSAVSPAPDLVQNLHTYFHTSVYSKIDTFISFQTDGTSRPDKWNVFSPIWHVSCGRKSANVWYVTLSVLHPQHKTWS